MAINKTRTSPAMKVGVVILIVAFVSGIGVIGIGALSGGSGGSSQQTAANSSQNGVAATLQNITASEMSTISPTEQALKSKPNDYGLLKQLGDAYYDYASQVAQAAPNAGVDLTIWRTSADYYRRAVAVKPGDPNVSTDMSIAQFYSGDVKGAIATIEPIIKADPKFAPAVYNSGVFYKNDSQPAKAIAAFQEYLRLEPNGPSAASAKQLMSEVQSSGQQAPSTNASGTSTSASGTGQ